jgi:hypothetical protein
MLSLSNVSILKNTTAVAPTAIAQWAKSIDGAGSVDQVRGVAVDTLGNVYAVGYYDTGAMTVDGVTLDAPAGGYAAYIIKFNTSGIAQWGKKIDGTGNDYGRGVAVDTSGNVYVTGYYSTASITVDGVTLPTPAGGTAGYIIKFNTSGIAQWGKKIDGASTDQGLGVAVDASGNVYVTGFYHTAAMTVDGVTLSIPSGTVGLTAAYIIKFDASGTAQWGKKIDGTSNDMGNGVAVDTAGNVYVTGYYSTASITVDGVTLPTPAGQAAFIIKFNTSGIAQWGKKIDSTGGEQGHGVAVDTSGNVYVTGYFNGAMTVDGVTFAVAVNNAGFIIKFNTSGTAQWGKKIDGTFTDVGQGVAVDTSGNVYVTGYYTAAITLDNGVSLLAPVSTGAFLIKYTTTGVAQWAKSIDSTGTDQGLGVAADAFGNVYVGGQYNAAITLDNDVSLPAPTSSGGFIIKYTSQDATLTPYKLISDTASTNSKLLVNTSPYTATVNVRNTADTATLNTLIVASGAYTAVSWSNAQFATDTLACPSLNVSGGKTIIDSLGGITGYNSNATWATSGDITCRSITTAIPTSALQVDESDATMLSLSNVSILKNTTAVAPTAIAQWAKSIDGTGDIDRVSGVATDASGNVYAVGQYRTGAITVDEVTLPTPAAAAAYIIKFDTSGTAQWGKKIDGTGDEHGYGVAVDTSGNVYVTGHYSGSTGAITVDGVTLPTPNGGLAAAFIIKFNASGTAQWGKRIDGPAHDYGRGVAVDTTGNVYVTGYYNAAITVDGVTLPQPAGGNFAAYIIKFNTSGIAQWEKGIDGTGNDYGQGVAVDTSGNVYVTGYYTAAITVDGVTLDAPLNAGNAAYIIKFNTSGTAQWGKKIDGTGTDIGQGVAVDTAGNVYVTGYYSAAITVDGVTLSTSSGNAAYIIKFNTSGTAQWGKKIDGTGSDYGQGVAVDTSGNVYVTGYYNAAITLDNGVRLLASTGLAAFLIKYTTSGVAQWAKSIDSTGGDYAYGIAADAFGNVYVGGLYNGAITLDNDVSLAAPSTSSGGFIIKYTSQDATLTPYKLISDTASTNSKLLVNTSPYTATVNVRDTADTATLNTLIVASGAYTAVSWSNAQFATDTLACPSLNVSGGKTIIDSLGGITGYNSNATWATSGDITCRSITTAIPTSTVLTVDESDALTLSTVANISILKNNPDVAKVVASWGKKIDGTGSEYGYGVAVDTLGNVYVTGWYNGSDTKVDGVTLPTPTTHAAYIIKFNTSGIVQWGKTIDGTGSDIGQGVAVDTLGNVYVTGYYSTASITVDGVTLPIPVGIAAYIIKFNTSGTAQWGKKIDGTGSDYGNGVAVDTSGNVYVTGYYDTGAITVDGVTLDAPAGNAAYIIKFNTSGTAQWGKKIDGPGNDNGQGVAVDTSGNVYVTGYYNAAITVDGVTLPQPAGSVAAYIIKFNTSGTAQWGKKIDGTGDDRGFGVAVDTSGNVYVTGYYDTAAIAVDGVTLDSPLGTSAVFLVKFNTSGTAQWGKKIDGTGTDIGQGVAVDTAGNVYVTGYYQASGITVDGGITLAIPQGGSRATYVVKYNTSGNAMWAHQIDGSGHVDGRGIAVDASNNVYVIGAYNNAAITVGINGITTLSAPVGPSQSYATFIIKFGQGGPYQLVSNTSTTTGFYKLLVNSSASPAVVEVRNVGNTTTLSTITVLSKAVKALTWYGTEFFAI